MLHQTGCSLYAVPLCSYHHFRAAPALATTYSPTRVSHSPEAIHLRTCTPAVPLLQGQVVPRSCATPVGEMRDGEQCVCASRRPQQWQWQCKSQSSHCSRPGVPRKHSFRCAHLPVSVSTVEESFSLKTRWIATPRYRSHTGTPSIHFIGCIVTIEDPKRRPHYSYSYQDQYQQRHYLCHFFNSSVTITRQSSNAPGYPESQYQCRKSHRHPYDQTNKLSGSQHNCQSDDACC